MTKMTLALLLFYILTYRVEWTVVTSCPPQINPWTGEADSIQLAIACSETKFKWLNKRFETKQELDAFLATKPADLKVTDISVVKHK